MKESYGTRFYNPNQASPVKQENENDEGEVVVIGKRQDNLEQTMNLIDQNDEGFQQFRQRKDTLMESIKQISKDKFSEDP